jgi:hypothetical protein
MLTNLIQHLVTFIQNENLAVSETKELVSDECVQSTWGGHNYVRVRILVLEDFGIFLNWGSAVEDSGLNVRHVLAETGVLVLNLVGQLTSMAHD